MLVRANDRGVDTDILEIWIVGKGMQEPMPHPALRPTGKPAKDTVPVSEFVWQITPRSSSFRQPEDRLNE
jgi:hypothetical protein